jgi:phospholipase C
MAIIIAYDDSGGWYDHETPPIINQSQISEDALTGSGTAGSQTPLGGYQGRPGYGFRVPLLVISPWAKENHVDHTLLDQTSILHFIEYNWKLDRIGDFSFDAFSSTLLHLFDFSHRHDRKLILHPKTGKKRS